MLDFIITQIGIDLQIRNMRRLVMLCKTVEMMDHIKYKLFQKKKKVKRPK